VTITGATGDKIAQAVAGAIKTRLPDEHDRGGEIGGSGAEIDYVIRARHQGAISYSC